MPDRFRLDLVERKITAGPPSTPMLIPHVPALSIDLSAIRTFCSASLGDAFVVINVL